MHRTATKALDVHPSGELAITHFGHGFGQVAAPPLISVPNRFFAAVEDIRDRLRIDLLLGEQCAHGHHRRRFTAQILQQHVCRQRGVHLVGCVHHADAAPRA